jgi:hypothetical protein
MEARRLLRTAAELTFRSKSRSSARRKASALRQAEEAPKKTSKNRNKFNFRIANFEKKNSELS